jgi:hypothetical protein
MDPWNNSIRKRQAIWPHRIRITIDQLKLASRCVAQPAVAKRIEYLFALVLDGAQSNGLVETAAIWTQDRWHFFLFPMKLTSTYQ